MLTEQSCLDCPWNAFALTSRSYSNVSITMNLVWLRQSHNRMLGVANLQIMPIIRRHVRGPRFTFRLRSTPHHPHEGLRVENLSITNVKLCETATPHMNATACRAFLNMNEFGLTLTQRYQLTREAGSVADAYPLPGVDRCFKIADLSRLYRK